MIPSFAVVGRTNKGKSSIVATLIENDRIAVAATPRTTSLSQGFTFKVDAKPLFTVFDTPGFEEAPAILEWLKAVPVPAHERRNRVLQFYQEFHQSGQFRYECELLKPILDGAAILYVADASHPYRPNFENEFEILQWTGQPSIALLNQIGEGHHEAEWTRALEQYFRKVLTFNAHTSWVGDRIQLIEELKFLSDSMREPLGLAISAMRRQLNNRLRDSALVIADLLEESLRFELKLDDANRRPESENAEAFLNALRALETKARADIASLFGFHDIDLRDSLSFAPGLEHDLFSKDAWEILGLSRKELLAVGAASGALAGGTVDAMVGGASFMMGTGIGGLVGGLSSAYLAFSDPAIGGFKLGKKKRTIGPYKNPNYPWVLIDRQLAFVQALLHRTHAQRGEVKMTEVEGKVGTSSHLGTKDKTRLGMIFQSIRWNVKLRSFSESLQEEITKQLLALAGSKKA